MYARRLCLLLLLTLAACSEPGPEDHARTPPTYRHSMDGAPGSLDPAHASSVYAKFPAPHGLSAFGMS